MKKIGILILALIVLFGAIGVGYAAWAQDLKIANTVNTGYISASFNAATFESRPYATDSYTISGSGALDPNQDALSDVLNITIQDAYPGFHQEITFWVKNNGTVPFYLNNLDPNLVVVKDGGLNGPEIGKIVNIPAPLSEFAPLVVEPNTVSSSGYTFMLTIPGTDEGSGNWVDPAQRHTYLVSIPLSVSQYLVP
jgi:hypothetical protein